MINELEKQLAAMTIDETKKSPIGEALHKGSAVVKGQDRKLVKAARKTAHGKQLDVEAEKRRKKDDMLFKATLKKQDSDSDWESVEEDFPHVKLEELLANLKIDDTPAKHDDSEDEEEKKE